MVSLKKTQIYKKNKLSEKMLCWNLNAWLEQPIYKLLLMMGFEGECDVIFTLHD